MNDLRGLTFDCTTEADGSCYCDYPSSLIAQGECKLRGDDVLDVRTNFRWSLHQICHLLTNSLETQTLEIGGISPVLYVGILVIIAVIFRVMLYVVLVFKKR